MTRSATPRITPSEMYRLEDLYGERPARLHKEAAELFKDRMTEDEYYVWADADYRAEAACGGRKICPACGCRSVLVRHFATRNYGGGWDTTEECDLDCGYREVFV